jgi:uncharacterized protein
MASRAPGVYREDIVLRPTPALRTGVPAFVGVARVPPSPSDDVVAEDPGGIVRLGPPPSLGDIPRSFVPPPRPPQVRLLTLWDDFRFITPDEGLLAPTVRAFFAGGGTRCYVLALSDTDAETVAGGLALLESVEDVDLVCAPDAVRGKSPEWQVVSEFQQAVLEHCATQGDRFAILDSVPGDTVFAPPLTDSNPHAAVRAQRAALTSPNGALYYPWLRRVDDPSALVPPSGTVAAVYARTDARVGVHKAPANEPLPDIVAVDVAVSDTAQAGLNEQGINCIRAIPGRGIRVWGARTLAAPEDASWKYVNVRRIFLTAARWIKRNVELSVFEPIAPELWATLRLQLTVYLTALYRVGALRGATPADAFYVKCDADNNPGEVRNAGSVVVELGLVPAVSNEFVVVQIVSHAGGVTVAAAPGP